MGFCMRHKPRRNHIAGYIKFQNDMFAIGSGSVLAWGEAVELASHLIYFASAWVEAVKLAGHLF